LLFPLYLNLLFNLEKKKNAGIYKRSILNFKGKKIRRKRIYKKELRLDILSRFFNSKQLIDLNLSFGISSSFISLIFL
jgi:hypothetical protein